MNYDVIIIGAGPGGIFSAYELTMLKPDLKVAVLKQVTPCISAVAPSTVRRSNPVSAAKAAPL